jgi:hypothetical protein
LSLFRKSEEEKAILSEKDIDKLINALKNNPDYKVRSAAAHSIKKIEGCVNDAAVDALGYAFSHDEHMQVRLAAIDALKKLKKKNSNAGQVLSLLHQTWDVVAEVSPVATRPEHDWKHLLKFPQMCVCCGALSPENKIEIRFHVGTTDTTSKTLLFPDPTGSVTNY